MAVVAIAGAYSDWVGDHMEMRMLTSWADRLRGLGFTAARLSGAGVLGSVLSAVVVTLLGYIVAQAKILAKLVQALGK